jgi:hypothetical protein
MPKTPYTMRDFNDDKVRQIMDFNPASGRLRQRSILELSIFVGAVLAYLGALALSA